MGESGRLNYLWGIFNGFNNHSKKKKKHVKKNDSQR